MLAKIYRLNKDRDYKRIYKYGSQIRGSFFKIKFLESQKPTSHIGVIVSSAVSKKSVDRNRIKRQILHILKSQMTNFNKNFDLAFYVYKIPQKGYNEYEKEIIYSLRKAKFIK